MVIRWSICLSICAQIAVWTDQTENPPVLLRHVEQLDKLPQNLVVALLQPVYVRDCNCDFARPTAACPGCTPAACPCSILLSVELKAQGGCFWECLCMNVHRAGWSVACKQFNQNCSCLPPASFADIP
jgi:hypothetical protein